MNDTMNSAVPSLTSSSSSYFSPQLWTWKMWLLLIVFFALLGINVFLFLAKGTQLLANISKTILGSVGNIAINTTKTVLGDVSVATNEASNDLSTINTTSTSSAMNEATYHADDSSSSIQSSKASGKAGWCYIGEDRGFRSCINVNRSDECMSGDIFPSKEICVNPNLRQ